jgi:pimeloyl-ACP methyl ester carboxylesterase
VTTSPHYFGPADQRLFGCYHASAAAAPATVGALLCQPTGHEYMACYRTVRQTAVRLAQAGLPAGDSAGESSDGSPSRWLRDVALAAGELQSRHPAGTALVGLRLGATLALEYLQDAKSIEARALVLWDPVVDGEAYVAELTALQGDRDESAADGEVLGFPFTDRLRGELERLNLLEVQRTAPRVLVIETVANAGTRTLAERLGTLGAAVEHRVMAGTALWHEPNKASVPANVIQSIVAWVRREA